MIGITKEFGPTVANSNVSLSVERGTIHALVGENGAGKTTLMRVLYGLHAPETGSIRINGVNIRFRSPREAIAAGIGMVSQHYAIIPELTCLDNLILGAENSWLLSRNEACERATKLASQMGFDFDWNQLAENLSPAGAQKLEILKLLWREAEIMILDEPTAMLAPEDAEALFEKLTILASQGKTIILVTHRLAEVIDHCKRATVLRGGKVVGEVEIDASSVQQLTEMIVGDSDFFHQKQEANSNSTGKASLFVSNLSVTGDRKNLAVDSAHFEVNEGEIVGIAGVDGSGQRELFEALLGIRSFTGSATLCGTELSRLSVSSRIANGIRVVPEDRHAQGVIDDWSLSDNAILGLQNLEPISSGAVLNLSARSDVTQRVISRFNTKCDGPHSSMSSLSGGNQQRFVAGRALENNPQLLLAFQPTRGLDIRGTADVYQALRNFCRDDKLAVLVVGFDLDELLENCDRILVVFSGKISSPPQSATKDRQIIGQMMVGVNPS